MWAARPSRREVMENEYGNHRRPTSHCELRVPLLEAPRWSVNKGRTRKGLFMGHTRSEARSGK